jgi:hypothetical protein
MRFEGLAELLPFQLEFFLFFCASSVLLLFPVQQGCESEFLKTLILGDEWRPSSEGCCAAVFDAESLRRYQMRASIDVSRTRARED